MALSRGPATSDLAALEAVTGVALSTLDLDELLQKLIECMIQVTGAQAGAILLLEDEQLVLRASHGLDDDLMAGYRLSPGAGFAGQVLREQRPVAVRNARDKTPAWLPDLKRRGIRSVLGVPLKTGAQTLGVAHIDLLEERDFNTREIKRFEVLADRAAIAISHSRLLRESQERATALAQANASLAAANAGLRESDRLKTDFLSMISHELRTPLTAIIGYTDLLLRGTPGKLNDRQRRHQQAVKLGAQKLLALINDLLDVSRLESGIIELELASIPLERVFELVLERAREAAGEARLSLRVELPADLPSVVGDQARLVQILENLLSNAIKFTPPGGRIDLWAEVPEDGRAKICVADTGAGIAAEHLHHIWDRFYQADSSVRRRYSGTGLGLAIVRKLVGLHGGEVSASSPGPGQGAVFCFDLPVAPPTADPRPPDAPAPLTRATVLVVEDQADNRELLGSLLREMLGLAVITASDGLEALELARQVPDLIVLDLMLPRLDGFEVVRRLKAAEETRAIPVLALTALTRPTEHEEALAAGCDAVITKPFDIDELVSALSERLRPA